MFRGAPLRRGPSADDPSSDASVPENEMLSMAPAQLELAAANARFTILAVKKPLAHRNGSKAQLHSSACTDQP